jgi:rod shape-determining protein MreD
MFLILNKGGILSHLMPINFDVDIAIIITVYIMAYRGEIGAGVFALGQGLLTDIFSGGMWGCYSTLYLAIFLLIKFLSRPFDLLSVVGQTLVVFIAVLAKDVLMILLSHIFSITISASFFNFLFIFSAICSGIVAPFLFYVLNTLINFSYKSKDES